MFILHCKWAAEDDDEEKERELKKSKVIEHVGSFWIHSLITGIYLDVVKTFPTLFSHVSTGPFSFTLPVMAGCKSDMFTDTN